MPHPVSRNQSGTRRQYIFIFITYPTVYNLNQNTMLYPISRLLSTLEPVENTWLTGTILAAVAFGVEITLCGLCLVALTKTPDFNISRRRCYWKPSQPVAFMGFVCLAVFLGTLHIVAQARVAQLAFVVNRNVAEIYELLTAITPVGNIASAVFVLINWLTDSLLVSENCCDFFLSCDSYSMFRYGGAFWFTRLQAGWFCALPRQYLAS